MTIKILSEDVAGKIAAGEVVERPVSVVKELIENSIDAKSTNIIIRAEQGGKRLIQVSDNGVGISASDLPLTIERYATSKIENAEDLNQIHSLGFRGEALASIAAISDFSIISNPKESQQGYIVQSFGGKKKTIEPTSSPYGTDVKVQNLFFNTPARLKFLKQEITEKKLIVGLVNRYALAYPCIRFQLMMDNRLFLQTSGDGDRRAILAQVYSLDDAKKMIEVEHKDGEIAIVGFISPVGLTRSNRKDVTFFTNGRWVQDSSLSTALLRAYSTFLMVGRYPLAFLLISIPPKEVDVNVHPAKIEIRFRNSPWVFSHVQRAVRKSLLSNYSTPEITPTFWKFENNRSDVQVPAWQVTKSTDTTMENIPDNLKKQDTSQSIGQVGFQIPLLRLVGQIGAAYIVAEGPDGLYLIDQHAAHERVLFEAFNKNLDSAGHSQLLLEPAVMQLSSASTHVLTENLPLLNSLGFAIEEFGTNSFLIRSVPAIFSLNDPLMLLNSVIEDFEEDETPFKNEIRKKIIARICKRSAIKSGKTLSHDEQQQLLSDLEKCESPRTCPHGRPTMIHLSVDLLERQFGRRGT